MSAPPVAMIDRTGFEYIRKLVLERAGISLGPDKQYLVQLRLAPLASAAGFDSVDQFVSFLGRSPGAPQHVAVVEAMTTNETSFFRDGAPFEAIRDHLLPSFLRSRPAQRSLRIWCGACSTGQEPYSIALMITHYFPQLLGRVEILGTDFSRGVLAVAEAGRFSPLDIQRGLPPEFLKLYFRSQGGDWVLNDKVRRLVSFRLLNLIEPWPAGTPFDLILLRNVMIYFNTETKRSIFRRLEGALHPEGQLFLGTSEAAIGLTDRFEKRTYGRAVYYEKTREASLKGCLAVTSQR